MVWFLVFSWDFTNWRKTQWLLNVSDSNVTEFYSFMEDVCFGRMLFMVFLVRGRVQCWELRWVNPNYCILYYTSTSVQKYEVIFVTSHFGKTQPKTSYTNVQCMIIRIRFYQWSASCVPGNSLPALFPLNVRVMPNNRNFQGRRC